MPDPVTRLRDATEGDLPQLARIYRDCFPEWTSAQLGLRTSQAYLRRMVGHEAYRFRVAAAEEAVRGFAVVRLDPSHELGHRWLLQAPGELIRLAVRKPSTFAERFTRAWRSPGKKWRGAGGAEGREEPADPDHLVLVWVAVAPGSRRQGVGQRLLHDAVEFAGTTGRSVLRLQTLPGNIPAHSAFLHAGFELVGRTEDDGMYIFERRLAGEAV